MEDRHLIFIHTDLRMHVNFDVFLWKEGTLKLPCTLIQCSTNIGRGATLSFALLRKNAKPRAFNSGLFQTCI